MTLEKNINPERSLEGLVIAHERLNDCAAYFLVTLHLEGTHPDGSRDYEIRSSAGCVQRPGPAPHVILQAVCDTLVKAAAEVHISRSDTEAKDDA